MTTTDNVVTDSLSQKPEAGAQGLRRALADALTRTPSGQADGGSRKQKATQTPPKRRVDAEDVIKSFNTWAFKREQPSDLDLMQRLISESIELAEPVSFVLYWGKGPRNTLDAPDVDCLNYLASLCQRISTVHAPGATFTLIFTDTHASLNGHAPQAMQAYFGAVETQARQHGFSTCLLSQLTKAAASHTTIEPVTEVPEDVRELLLESAAKWYRGEGSAEEGALKYYQQNMVERQAVEHAFPRSIFVTFNGSKVRSIFPTRIPIFYMYSLRRGFAVKPWFLSADASSSDASTRQIA